MLTWLFLQLLMLRVPLKKGDFYKTRIVYRLALIHAICSSNLQSELKVTYVTVPSRFNNGIFQHHYVT